MKLTYQHMKTKTITSRSFAKRALMVLAVLFTTLTAGATEFITDVMLIGNKNETEFKNLQDKLEKEGWTAIKKDLNAGAGGDYIYLLYKSEENNDGKNYGYITDFYIFGSESDSFDEEVTYQGCTYKLVPYDGSDAFKNSKGDLNRGAGGRYIHLYFTKKFKGGEAVSGIAFNNNQMNALGNMGMFSITGYNLNEGCSSGDMIYMHISKKKASTPTSVDYVSYTYDTTNGLKSEAKTCNSFQLVESDDCNWASGWYLASGNVTLDDRITVKGKVNLILRDGCKLVAKKGIGVAKDKTLNIFAQSEGDNAGSLKAIAPITDCDAGIGGGRNGSGGTVTIYGGTVEAHGGDGAAGIGGGIYSSGGSFAIYGGKVDAYSGGQATGIGGGYCGAGGEVTIYGGVVEAHGGYCRAGIGGDTGKTHGTLKIGDGVNVYDFDNPSNPIATGPQENVESRTQNMFVGKMFPVSYLKYSFDEDTKTLTSEKKKCDDYTEVTSGTTTFSNGWYVLSSSQSFDDRIEVSGTVNLILLDGCTLEAKKGVEVAKGNTLNIFAQSEGANTGQLKAIATDNTYFSGIGGGHKCSGGMVNIYSGTVEAHGGMYGAGIGGGDEGSGTVTIYGGSVEAYGREFGAGIGGGWGGSGTVTVYGGTVETHGGEYGAGIGVGYLGAGGEVTIYDGTVEAHGGDSGAGIGGGYTCAGVTVSIYGGMVEANGGYFATGIGAGRSSDSHGTLKIGDGVKVYGGDSENPTTVIATGPKDNVDSRPQYMIAGGHVKGDANDDVRVNAADIVEMVNAKNNKASDKFVLKYADIDGNGNITQEDIDAVVKIIMQK